MPTVIRRSETVTVGRQAPRSSRRPGLAGDQARLEPADRFV